MKFLLTLAVLIVGVDIDILFGAALATSQEEIYVARDRVLPALVHIQPVIKNYNTGELEKQAVVGSGVIFHQDGYVVTNFHVAGKSERIICTLFDKEQVNATFVGGDPMTDVAVIKLDLSDHTGRLPVAEFGNSDSLKVGQFVLAMGSPLSLSRSVSAGVVSTKDRYFSPEVRLPSGERTGRYNLWIQTDAAINPGNSGGPLVDMSGLVIGINSRATLFANNLGFAIPINVVKEVVHDILTDGKVSRSWLGLHCQALQELESYFGTERDNGVLVASIDPGSPADASFLKAGDIILEVNSQPVSARFVEELPAFYNKIAKYPPGSELTLKILRNEQSYTIKVVTRELGDLQGEDFESKEWGFTVKAITRQMQVENQLDDTLGVIVIGVKTASAADEGGLQPNDVVTMVNDQVVMTLGEFMEMYDHVQSIDDDGILITINRGGSTRFVFLKLDRRAEEMPHGE